MNGVGIAIEFVTQKCADDLQDGAARPAADVAARQHQRRRTEGYGFLGLLYGGNAGLANLRALQARRVRPAVRGGARSMPDGPERTKLVQRDVGDRRRLRAVEAQRVPLRERARAIRGSKATSTTRSTGTHGPTMTSTASGASGEPMSAVPLVAAALARRRVRRYPAARAGAGEVGRPGEGAARRRSRSRRRVSIRRRRPTIYSNYVERAIFEPLYRYDYLARPHKVVPNTAAAMPEISADGRSGRSASGRASTSPTIRRSRARSASSPPTTTSTRSSACSTRGCARRFLVVPRRQDRRGRRGAREGEKGRASSTTTCRSKG